MNAASTIEQALTDADTARDALLAVAELLEQCQDLPSPHQLAALVQILAERIPGFTYRLEDDDGLDLTASGANDPH